MSALDDTPMHQGLDVYDLSANVQPGSAYTFAVSMLAPSDPGSYGETWEVGHANQQLCPFSVYIDVKLRAWIFMG